MKHLRIIKLLILITLPTFVMSQQTNLHILDSLNVIVDSTHSMNSIFESLHEIKASDSTLKTSFVLIGDSHIQAGLFTGEIRNDLQNEFGHAGYGIVTPLRMIRTNQPSDYHMQSPNKWTGGRCSLNYKEKMTFGIGGISANCSDSAIQVYIKVDSPENCFTRLTIFDNHNVFAIDSIDNQKEVVADGVTNYTLSQAVNHVSISANDTDGTVSLYGINLENDNKGIVFSSIGVNGAQYFQFARIPDYGKLISYLQPSLIIISMGTNEAYENKYNDSTFYSQINTLVQELKEANPNAVLLLTTPMQSYKRYKKKLYVNKNVVKARNTIISYAVNNHLAYWDLYGIAGGIGAAHTWKSNGLMAKDGVHFTKGGYQIQGKLFYDALMKSYNNDVKH